MTTAIIIGGGIAGYSTAYALAKRGIAVTLLSAIMRSHKKPLAIMPLCYTLSLV